MTGPHTAPHTAPRREELLTAVLADAPAVERAQLTRIELAPGQAPGAHHHPCDVVGIVVDGTIRYQIDGSSETILRAGDAFFEPRNTPVLCFDNFSPSASATFVACYLRAPGQSDVIVMAPPGVGQ